MASGSLVRQWRRNKRRLLNLHAGLARRRLRPVRAKFYSDLWTNSAEAIGAEISAKPNGLLEIRKNNLATYVRQSDLMLDSDITLSVFANKALHYELMVQKSLRLPEFKNFTLGSLSEAEQFLKAQAGPIVVKPADGTGGGQGVVTGITNLSALKAAAQHASGYNPRLIAEKQLTGACYRLVYLNGEFLDAVRRDSPSVTGDGTSTIAHLVKAENSAREDINNIRALNPLILDQESRNTLTADGLTPKTVLAAGTSARVKLAVNENSAAENHIVRELVNAEIIELGARLVRDFGLKFAGLDITSDDISAPLLDGDTYFNEINVNPGIHHHYLVSNPSQSAKLAPQLLDRMFTSKMGTIQL
ncbi:MAG: hypothetical protein ACE37M_10565 [Henriciella sp.]